MFTLGLAGHAAELHGHEYSAPRRIRSVQHKSPPLKSNFDVPVPPRRAFTALGTRTQIEPDRPSRSSSVDTNHSVERVMFADPEAEYYSDGKLSRSGSTGSRASIGGIRKRSAPRTRKSFQLARPPPSLGHKQRLNLRPK